MNGQLFELTQVINIAAERLPRKVGIYFLLCHGEIVYIGRAIDVDRRVQDHKKKDYDSWAWVPCPARQQERLERAYLDKFIPPLNRDYHTELARRAEAHFVEKLHANKTRIRGGRQTPSGCYWRNCTLWGRIKINRVEYRQSLRTDDLKVAARRRLVWAERLQEIHLQSMAQHPMDKPIAAVNITDRQFESSL